ncbi:MAG: hypothetical protein M1372_01270 [Patescibacteria group bacterium]|nr:hypothetical protein [Patescibacteria group bacterium]
MLLDAGEVLPHLQSIRSDSFRVVRDEKEESIVLVDVDPYLVQRNIMRRNPDDKALMDAEFIKLISSLFWSTWCREDEREEVMFEFVRSLTPIVTPTMLPAVEMAYMKAHAMSRGAINQS